MRAAALCVREPVRVDGKLLIDTIRTMTVILASLTAGYCLRKSGRGTPALATAVNRFTLMFIQPLVIGLALWAMKPPDWRTLALPIYGVALILLLWPFSRSWPGRSPWTARAADLRHLLHVLQRRLHLRHFYRLRGNGRARRSAGLGLLHELHARLLHLRFLRGRRYSTAEQQGALQALWSTFRDAETRNPILGIAIGLALNLLRVKPLAETPFIIDIAMPLTTAAFLLAIGLGLRLSTVKTYWRECLLLHAGKFLMGPVLGLGLAFAFDYWQIADHSLLKVAFIEAAAPTAIMSVMLADVFDLNRGMAGRAVAHDECYGVFLAPLILMVDGRL